MTFVKEKNVLPTWVDQLAWDIQRLRKLKKELALTFLPMILPKYSHKPASISLLMNRWSTYSQFGFKQLKHLEMKLIFIIITNFVTSVVFSSLLPCNGISSRIPIFYYILCQETIFEPVQIFFNLYMQVTDEIQFINDLIETKTSTLNPSTLC